MNRSSTNWLCIIGLVLAITSIGPAFSDDEDRGFLERPPVFLDSEPDIPLAFLSAGIPKPGSTLQDFDGLTQGSDGFKRSGENVQPNLGVRFQVYRISALAGFKKGWGAGIIIPWQQTRVLGTMGGLPTTTDHTDLGDISFLGKKRVWQGTTGDDIILTGGLEIPTGKDDLSFDQSNAATNAYYTSTPGRVPVSWQPGSGSVNGYIGMAYRRGGHRLSYAGLLATKLHTSGHEDAKIGDTFVAAATSTYGIARNIALSLALVLKTQGDDDYPNAPPPGVNQPLTDGTTNHGTTLFLNPSVRFNVAKNTLVGIGLRFPVMTPDDGLVPDTRGFLIIAPRF